MLKPRKIKNFTVTLFADQFERVKAALRKAGSTANVSGYLRQLLDRELEEAERAEK